MKNEQGEPICASCGVPWRHHEGTVSMCDQLQEVTKEADALRRRESQVMGMLADSAVSSTDLVEGVEALVGERDRLVDVLKCERGDESGAPEGWAWTPDKTGTFGWSKGQIAYTAQCRNGEWVWSILSGGGMGGTPTALEAMEVVDKALAEAGK